MSIFIDLERRRPTRAQSSCHMYEDIWASWKDTLENSFFTFPRPKPSELPFEISHCTEITFGMGEDIGPPKIVARRALSDDFSRLWIAPGMTTFWVSIPGSRLREGGLPKIRTWMGPTRSEHATHEVPREPCVQGCWKARRRPREWDWERRHGDEVSEIEKGRK